jgi:Phosphotransferase enzyme family
MPTLNWPDTLPAAAEAAAWLARTLPGQPRVSGPRQILRAKPWGVVATFDVQAAKGPAETLVFKASHLPLFIHAPRIEHLLMRHSPGDAPQLLASQSWPSHCWSVYRHVSGTAVAALGSLGALAALAEQFGRVQARVATCRAEALAGLPRSPVSAIPAALAGVRRALLDHHVPDWQTVEQRDPWGLPGNLARRLARIEPRLAEWAAELQAGPWPLTLDHVDLHSQNAVQTPDGRILIHDWEEACVGLPFFSLDRLLEDARELDVQRGVVPLHWPGFTSPAEQVVRLAYLRALPWGTLAQRSRALDLALCLAPIKTLQESQVFARAQGWRRSSPEQAASLLAKACARWPALQQAERLAAA